MNFVLKNLSDSEINRIETFYQDFKVANNNTYIRFFAKTEYITVTVYSTNKVMFQGEDAKEEYDMWVNMLAYHEESTKTKTPNFKDYFYPSIGSDEVGTGDFFGPIIVCAYHLKQADVKTYKALNIKDSKRLSDDYILSLGEAIKEIGTYSLLTLHNDKYNQLIERGFNMNKIKAYLHNKAILNLLNKINGNPEIIMDQFTPEKNYFRYLNKEQHVCRNITFLTKAESRYASVALASILARYAFLKHFNVLSKQIGLTLPKGASLKVDEIAAKLIEERGEKCLYDIAKLNFKTFNKAKALLK
ncbi:MAG: ribonuclease HIII [Candidatus Izimaplasma sp.]|nr:ribonuclease HIII [Candidatus Izimaplasma bacterium]